MTARSILTSAETTTSRINPDRYVAHTLALLLAKFLGGGVPRSLLARRLREVADRIDAMNVPAQPEKTAQGNVEAAKRVFEHWVSVMRRDPKTTRFTSGRKQKIGARLRNYTEAQLLGAINGCASSEFHMGKNPEKVTHSDLELILRSDEKLEYFLRLATDRGVLQVRTADKELERLHAAAEKALNAGDHDTYGRVNAAIADRVRATGADQA